MAGNEEVRVKVALLEPLTGLDMPSGVDVRYYTVEEAVRRGLVKRVVLLNAALAFPGKIAYARRASFEELREVIGEARRLGLPVVSYIGHPATAELLSKMLGVEIPVNRAMYQPGEADLVYVVRLKKRLATPQEVVELTPEDLEVIQVHYA